MTSVASAASIRVKRSVAALMAGFGYAVSGCAARSPSEGRALSFSKLARSSAAAVGAGTEPGATTSVTV